MKLSAATDRRRHGRFPQTFDLVLRPLPELGLPKAKQIKVAGRIQDISKGGICVLTPRPVDVSQVYVCEFLLHDSPPIKVSTLMRVCWSQMHTVPDESYFSGLAFLI